MGYDLHIERSREDQEAETITLQEWVTVIAADPELKAIDAVWATNPKTGEVITIRCPGSAQWVRSSNPLVTFAYRSGKISAKNPSEPVLAKMKQLAARLGALVVGDEGELY